MSATGKQGIPARNGTDGMKGEDGQKGEVGLKGQKGDMGNFGETGENGTDGERVSGEYNSTYVPLWWGLNCSYHWMSFLHTVDLAYVLLFSGNTHMYMYIDAPVVRNLVE